MKLGLSGRYKLEQYSEDGEIKFSSEFNNLITDDGLTMMGTFEATGTNGYMQWVALNSDNSEPTPDEGVEAGDVEYRSSTATRTSDTYIETPEQGGVLSRRFILPALTSNQNFSSILVGMRFDGAGRRLFSRALIRDLQGEPTTLTGLTGDIFIVTYNLEFIPQGEVSGTLELTGAKGGTYEWTARPANIDSGTDGTSNNFLGRRLRAAMNAVGTTSATNRTYTGDLGPTTGVPTGTVNTAVTDLVADVTSLAEEHRTLITYRNGNRAHPTTISCYVCRMGPFCYQIQFFPPIIKSNPGVLEFNFEIQWGRAEDIGL